VISKPRLRIHHEWELQEIVGKSRNSVVIEVNWISQYDAAVTALTSDAPVYRQASEIVMSRLRCLIP
jgi:hypothetical protein